MLGTCSRWTVTVSATKEKVQDASLLLKWLQKDMLARKSAFHSQTKFFTTLNHMMVYSILHFVLKWQKYFCQQWLLVACCVLWWSLTNPLAAAQHAGESTKVNVFWVVSSHKVLSYHRIGNYRHSQHDVMEVWMMSHIGQEDRFSFFFKQNSPVSYFYQCGWISQQSFPTEIKWQTCRPTVDPQAPWSNLIRIFFMEIILETVHKAAASEFWYTQYPHCGWL